MGGSASSPESPQLSPDIRVPREGEEITTISKGCGQVSISSGSAFRPCSDPTDDYAEKCGRSRAKSEKSASSRPASPCTPRRPTVLDDDDGRESGDDGDEDECDDDDEEEEECDDDEEEEDDDEDENEYRAQAKTEYFPCRDPVNEDSSKNDGTRPSPFLPCRDPVADDTSSDCSRSSSRSSCSSRRENKKEKREGRSPSPRIRSSVSEFTPCRDAKSSGRPATRSGSRSPSPPAFFPCRDTASDHGSPAKQRGSGRANMSPCTSGKPYVQSSGKPETPAGCFSSEVYVPNKAESKAGDEKAVNPCNVKSDMESEKSCKICDDDPPQLQEVKKNGSVACKNKSTRKETSPKKKNEEAIYGEKIKDLQKGCAYLSRKELRKVCDKYQSYGYIKDKGCGFPEKKRELSRKEEAVYTTTYPKCKESDSDSDYSGSSGPGGHSVECGLEGELVSLADVDSRYSRLTLQEAAQMIGRASTTADDTEYTIEKSTAANKKWSEGLPSLSYVHRPRKKIVTSDAQKGEDCGVDRTCEKTRSENENISRSRKRSKSKSPDRMTYTVFTNRYLADKPSNAARGSRNESSESDQKSTCDNDGFSASWDSRQSQQRSNDAARPSKWMNQSNSNSCDFEEDSSPGSNGGVAESDDNSSLSAVVGPHIPEVDDLWFECWEEGVVAQKDLKTTRQDEHCRNVAQILGNRRLTQNFTRDFSFPLSANTNNPDVFCDKSTGATLQEIGDTQTGSFQIISGVTRSSKKLPLFDCHDITDSCFLQDVNGFDKQASAEVSKNINSNADSLLHDKKRTLKNKRLLSQEIPGPPVISTFPGQSSEESSPEPHQYGVQPTDGILEGIRVKLLKQGKPAFDFDLARHLGLTNLEIKQLLESMTEGALPSTEILERIGLQMFDVDMARDMGLSRGQVRQLMNASVQVSRVGSGLFDVDLAKEMGLRESQIKQLAESFSANNRAKFPPFDLNLAMEMGLSQKQAKQLADVSAQVSRVGSGIIDKNLAKNMGLSDGQIQQLAESSAIPGGGHILFDPDLAAHMGLNSAQIKQLADSSAQVSRVASGLLNVGLAKQMGLSDRQVRQLMDSAQVSRVGSGILQAQGGQRMFDLSTARAMGLNEREVRQLVTSSTQVSRTTSALQAASSQSALPYGDGFHGGDAKKKGRPNRRDALISRLQASVESGDKVNNVLTTLVEWNTILLVVIFLLLLATSCPGPARPFLPCPLPSVCRALHRELIAPLSLDKAICRWMDQPGTSPVQPDPPPLWTRAWEGAFGGRRPTVKPPPQGKLYPLMYRMGSGVTRSVYDGGSFLFTYLLLPIISLPVVVVGPLLGVLYSALSCTMRTGLYVVFYVCGSLLGVPIPFSLGAVQQGMQSVAPLLPAATPTHLPAAEPRAVDSKGAHPGIQPWKDGALTGVGGPPLEPPNQLGIEDSPVPPDPPGVPNPDFHELHQRGGFFFYMGFDPPKEGCDYSFLSIGLLWLLGYLPEQCA